jgi:ribosomal protein L11 methyltransferase
MGWDNLEDIHILESEEFKIDYTFAEIEPINWTKNGKNFEPIDVKEIVTFVPFHPKTDAEYDILIEPKWAFGHHETTHMMIQHLLETDVTGMKTLIWVAVQQFW